MCGFFNPASDNWMLGCRNRSYTINVCPAGSERVKVSQQSKHPLFSLQRLLEPIMCGNSLWMCPAVQVSVPSGPHLKEGRDLQAEDWARLHWASNVWIIQHTEDDSNAIKTWNIYCVFVRQWCASVYTCHTSCSLTDTFWGRNVGVCVCVLFYCPFGDQCKF